MKHVLMLLLALYGFSAMCTEGLQVRSEGKPPFKDTKAGTIIDYGSGVYVEKHLILTCHHVIEKGVAFEYKLPGKEWTPAKIWAFDPINDLAILHTEEEGVPIELANVPALTVSGSAQDEPVHNTFVFMNNATLYVGPYDESNKNESVKLCGSSGSPIIADGRLIAIVKTQLNRRVKDYKKESGDAPPGVYVIITSVDVIDKFLASVSVLK
jgi:hypothetical protein